MTAISCRFGVRGPLLERVPVHAPQHRRHTFILKNACASFEKNRESVTKAQKAPDLGLLKRDDERGFFQKKTSDQRCENLPAPAICNLLVFGAG